jgi:hypothetical protein
MHDSHMVSVEQISLESIIRRAYESFAMSLLATRTMTLLIGGFSDAATAERDYLANRRPDIDVAQELSLQDSAFVSVVKEYAIDAELYVAWVRERNGAPFWESTLIAYCRAFEHCLKSIAVALHIASIKSSSDLSILINLPSQELMIARRRIGRIWVFANNDIAQPKIQSFFEATINVTLPKALNINLMNTTAQSDWDNASKAFQIRNAIVHNLGVMPQSLSLGGVEFYAGWPISLTEKSVSEVRVSLEKILEPFRSDNLDRWSKSN